MLTCDLYRSLHSSAFRLDVGTIYGARRVVDVITEKKTAQGKLKIGRV